MFISRRRTYPPTCGHHGGDAAHPRRLPRTPAKQEVDDLPAEPLAARHVHKEVDDGVGVADEAGDGVPEPDDVSLVQVARVVVAAQAARGGLVVGRVDVVQHGRLADEEHEAQEGQRDHDLPRRLFLVRVRAPRLHQRPAEATVKVHQVLNVLKEILIIVVNELA